MIRIGIVGTGGMAHGHAINFNRIKGAKVTACCDISREKAKAFAAKYKILRAYTDYREMINEERLDALSIVTNDNMHAPISIAAAAKGLHILCEKPLSTNLADAKKMLAAVKEAGVVNMVNFSYRDSSGVQGAARVIARGAIGRIMHVEASYLQSWLVANTWGDWRTTESWTWRLSTAGGGQGTLGDLGCHIYDLVTVLVGDIGEIHCRLKTFEKGIKGNRIGKYLLDANDSFASSVVFKNGALGVIHSSRWGTGHVNSVRVRVCGDEGAVRIDLDGSWDEYFICAGTRNINKGQWKKVRCRPRPNMFERFVRSVKSGRQDPCDFANGVKNQSYLHYSIESHKKNRSLRVR